MEHNYRALAVASNTAITLQSIQEQLLEEYGPYINRLLRRNSFVSNYHDAEDCRSAMLEKICQMANDIYHGKLKREGEELSKYIFKALQNGNYDYSRYIHKAPIKQKKADGTIEETSIRIVNTEHIEFMVESFGEAEHAGISELEYNNIDHVDIIKTIEQITSLIESAPNGLLLDDIKILRLYHVEEMTYKQIGELLNRPTSTMRDQIKAAEKNIYQILCMYELRAEALAHPYAY